MAEPDFEQLVADLPKALLVCDAARRLVYVNDAGMRLFALEGPAAALGRDVLDLVQPGSRPTLRHALAQVLDTGTVVHVAEAHALHADGPGPQITAVAGPTSFRGQQAVQLLARETAGGADARGLAYRATHDDLTGLPNRPLLEDRWAQARARTARTSGCLFVLFCDLDGFKAVNDARGHRAGDLVLRHVASVLDAAVRGQDTLARVGGDEFVAVVEVADAAEAEGLAQRLRRAVSGLRHPDLTEPLGLSVGVAPDDPAAALADVLAAADSLMYQEKRREP